jgi:hypothetical protein
LIRAAEAGLRIRPPNRLANGTAADLDFKARRLGARVLRVPEDYPTIKAAIDASINGDVIVAAPRWCEENTHFKGKLITLTSTNPDDDEVVQMTAIHGGQNGPVVTFENGETSQAVITGFTIRNGSGRASD